MLYRTICGNLQPEPAQIQLYNWNRGSKQKIKVITFQFFNKTRIKSGHVKNRGSKHALDNEILKLQNEGKSLNDIIDLINTKYI